MTGASPPVGGAHPQQRRSSPFVRVLQVTVGLGPVSYTHLTLPTIYSV